MSSCTLHYKFLAAAFLIVHFLSACGSNDSNHSAESNTPQLPDSTTNPDDEAKGLPKPVVKILPLGDSITQGGSGYASYRRDLWFLLKDEGYNVDFVGSKDDFHGDVVDSLKDFDLDHEGHWAWETGEIGAKLEGWLDNGPVDIVLLHVGTNDFDRGQSNDSTMKELSSIISKLRKNNPDVVILLAKIIPMKNKDTSEINDSIAILAKDESTKRSPVVIVDQYEGYRPLTDNHDNYHPNTEGERKIAAKWFGKLSEFLDK